MVKHLDRKVLMVPVNAEQALYAGMPISIEKIDSYSKWYGKFIFWWAGLSEKMPISYGVDLYRVIYLSAGEVGDLVKVSGLMSLPKGVESHSVMTWLHGTSMLRADVPSTPTLEEGVMASLVFAGDGAILLAPDYIGYGQSSLPHPYYHLATSVGVTRDLISASQTILRASGVDVPSRLFLTGFSQGAMNAMATARDIEQSPISGLKLIATASVAGPIDLQGTSLKLAIESNSVHASTYLAFIFNTYARVYKHELSDVVREPYASIIPELFDGKTKGEEVVQKIGSDPRQLLRTDFIESYFNANRGWAGQRLEENSLTTWLPKTPLRLYYGSRDIDVSPLEAQSQVIKWGEQGVQVQAVDVGPFDHNESIIHAVPMIRRWFAEFEEAEI